MSNRYKGGVISATPPTTTGGESGTASGAWTLEQQMQLQAAGLWPIQPPPPYIEDVFSTYLYTGTGAAQTITNGINLSGKGGLVWIKNRNFVGSTDHELFDTSRGATKRLKSNTTDAQLTTAGTLDSFNTTGFTLGSQSSVNFNTYLFASWTFREQAKFFDIVTWTGDGTGTRTITHNLQGTVGCVIAKRLDAAGVWVVQHRALTNAWTAARLFLNTDAAVNAFSNFTNPTNTTIDIDSNLNGSGAQWVAYFFAHDAGGFGLTETDNVISCGSFSVPDQGPQATVTLGYEPQWIMVKRTNGTGNWLIFDTMRGWVVGTASTDADDEALWANLADAANPNSGGGFPTATGFVYPPAGAGDATYIYIAIRRGPMKVPTSGTSVYQAVTRTGNSPTVNSITSVGFPPDSIWQKRVSGSTASSNVFDRLRGRYFLAPATTSAETAANTSSTRDLISFDMTGFTVGEQYSSELNANTRPEVYWNFLRAPGFFDEVCYTGTGSATTQTHNLAAVPELMIVKRRSGAANWPVYSATSGNTKYQYLNSTLQADTFNMWNNTTPTASVFSISGDTDVNGSGSTYVAYLFATCAGVSKVGSYTGSSSSDVVVDCGFAAGARFVLIKRTDATGDWYVYDSARGINPSNDPYLLINSTAAEVTGTNYIGPYSTGFYVNTGTPLNATTGATYIFLAIA